MNPLAEIIDVFFNRNRTPIGFTGRPLTVISEREKSQLREIARLRRILETVSKERDEYKADYFRIHREFVELKYPNSKFKGDK